MELWALTWREFDALAMALRRRIRRDDARAARICQAVVGAMTGKVVELEKFMPQDDPELDESSDDRTAVHLANVVAKLGKNAVSVQREVDPADQEFRERMWKLMGVTN